MIDKNTEYQICNQCIMDTTDKNITFNQNGVCDYCINYKKNIKTYLEENIENNEKYFFNLKADLKNHKKKGNSEYDCLIGFSGGVDSSYLVYYVINELKLKPLLFHVDTGWNNKIAISNIEKFIDKYDVDLHTDVVDWSEMKDLALSFFKAQVPTIDAVQDHAIWASTFKFAKANNFKYILTGGNLHTECFREPIYWSYHAGDLTQIKDIQKRFGSRKLKKFPTCDILNYAIYYRYVLGIKIVQPLNYIKYSKSEAINLLRKEVEWTDYGGKHHESNFTKFIEGYWQPTKFNIDKRKVHLSSLIMSQELTRDDALKKFNEPSFDQSELNKDFNYIALNLGITHKELKELYMQDNKYHHDYKSKDIILSLILKILRILKLEKRIMR